MTVKTAHRQFGSKARVAAGLAALVPPGTKAWVEVFAGTAAVTLAKPPHPAEHLNDMNGDIVNLFSVLRDAPSRGRLIEAVELTPWAEEEFAAAKDRAAVADPVERARLFLISSWQGVGGSQRASAGWRLERRSGSHISVWRTVPERLASVGERLRQVYVHQKDAVDIVRRFGDLEDACLFVDPPYPSTSLATNASQYAVNMDDSQHAALVEALARIRAKAIVTMNPGTVYEKLAAEHGWRRSIILVRGLRNSVKEEVVYTNFEPTAEPPLSDDGPATEEP
jgi:DNA adenine methylase